MRPDAAVLARARALSAVSCGISLLIAAGVRVTLDDGGWPLIVPAVAAAIAAALPRRGTLILALVVTAAILLLGLMTVGILFGFSLPPLILALGAFTKGNTPALEGRPTGS